MFSKCVILCSGVCFAHYKTYEGGKIMARQKLAGIMKLITAELGDTLPEKAFLLDLKRSIEMTDKKESHVGSPNYKPSCMGCIRQMYYIRNGVPEDESNNVDYQLIGICNSGSDIHIRIQTYISKMKENGIDCEYVDVGEFVKSRELQDIEVVSQNGMETKLYHRQLHLSFLCDGIIKYKGIYYILELKSEGSNKFWQREGVDPSHFNQATCYSLSLGLDNVVFVYINRDNLDMKSFMFTVTPDMKQNIVGLITNCENYVNQHQVPPKPTNVTPKTCNYCHHRELCRRD